MIKLSAGRVTRAAARDLLFDLPGPTDPRADLEARVKRHMGPSSRLELRLTDNRSTMISVRNETDRFVLRLHHMFLGADPKVVLALARYVEKDDRRASLALNRFIDGHSARIKRSRRVAPAPRPIEPRGEVHDLSSIFAELNARYFRNAIVARITWGPRLSPQLRGRLRRSLKMGSYCVEDRLIRIHPSLDRTSVPREFLAWIVYHEMLHEKHDMPLVGGRRQFHTPAFLADEARFAGYELARRWEREHLDLLLSY